VAVCGVLKLAVDFLNTAAPIGQRVDGGIEDLIIWVGLLPLILSRMTRRQRAILAWGATKFGLGFAAFIMMTVGTGTSYQSGQPRDALLFFLLGLIWLPSLELFRGLHRIKNTSLLRALFFPFRSSSLVFKEAIGVGASRAN